MIYPDAARFAAAREALLENHSRYNIGTYQERSQHLILKRYFEPDPARHEIPLEGYIADIYGDAGVIEIQTSGFGALRNKLEVFLRHYPVTLVYPSAVKKRVVWTDPETGDMCVGSYRNRKSARYSVFAELLYISSFFAHPNLCVLNVLTAASDYKLLDGFGKDQKSRATKTDTVPDELLEIVPLKSLDDVLRMLPVSTGEAFTNAELEKIFGMRGRRLWAAVKFLENAGAIWRSGKKGNNLLYTVGNPNENGGLYSESAGCEYI